MGFIKSVPKCALVLIFGAALHATTVPSLSFEELVDQSDMVISGQVTRSWSAWDDEHKYIWTHYEVAVTRAAKGAPGSTVIVSEPGGSVGIAGMSIAGAVPYLPAEHVAIFLRRMPNGYLRTTGWGQGKLKLDASGHLHRDASAGANLMMPAVSRKRSVESTTLDRLEGISFAELTSRIAAHIANGASQGSAK